jgi:two-component system response regulator MprA
MHILVVDDDPAVRVAIASALQLEGYDVTQAGDGDSALQSMASSPPDAMVLDVMMSGRDGLSVCRLLRAAGDRTPIIVLTARGEVSDRVAGLDAGADDYLPKPFDLGELAARLRALLRRTQPDLPLVSSFADLSFDTTTRTASRGSRQIELSRTESAMLELFLLNPGQVLTREVISDRVWETDFGPASNSIAVYISYLRAKLEAGGEPRLIHTVRGLGYRLVAP